MINILAGGSFNVQGIFTAPGYSKKIDADFVKFIFSPLFLLGFGAVGFDDLQVSLGNDDGFVAGRSYPVGGQDDPAYSQLILKIDNREFVGFAYSGEIIIEERSETLIKGSLKLFYKMAAEGIDCDLTGTFAITP